MEFLTIDILSYITISLIVVTIILIVIIIRLNKRISNLLKGKEAKTLEDQILKLNKDAEAYYAFKSELEKYLMTVEKRLKRSIQGVENINFSAFTGADSGAKSFATALVNENGDGIIVSSLNARDRLSIFTKDVSKWKTERELSEEETAALTKAKQSCSL